MWDGGRSVSGVGGMPRVAQNLLGGGTMEGGETSDKVFGFTRNGVPVRPLKVDFRVSILLDKGLGVVGTKRGITAEENVRDNGCAEREAMSLPFVCVCVWKRSYLSTRCPWVFRGRCS